MGYRQEHRMGLGTHYSGSGRDRLAVVSDDPRFRAPGLTSVPPPDITAVGTSMTGFQEAKRKQESFLAPFEKRCLIWLARHAPQWVNSDHLTLLGLAALAGAGLSYWWARTNPAGLYVVIVCLALNWLGDSLDGTLAPRAQPPASTLRVLRG